MMPTFKEFWNKYKVYMRVDVLMYGSFILTFFLLWLIWG
jgi:hypothetical protein